jgi:hypothetical protein
MSHRKASTPYSKNGYYELHDQDGNDPRSSINSLSPIFPKSETEERLEEVPDSHATFSSEGLEDYYKPIEGYEGAHRYDPGYAWSPLDERRVVRKVRALTERKIQVDAIANSPED